MKEIRIEKVYDGHPGRQTTFINLKQVAPGQVEYSESFYPSRHSMAIESEPIVITAKKANEIFFELKKYAEPYIRYDQNRFFRPMK